MSSWIVLLNFFAQKIFSPVPYAQDCIVLLQCTVWLWCLLIISEWRDKFIHTDELADKICMEVWIICKADLGVDGQVDKTCVSTWLPVHLCKQVLYELKGNRAPITWHLIKNFLPSNKDGCTICQNVRKFVCSEEDREGPRNKLVRSWSWWLLSCQQLALLVGVVQPLCLLHGFLLTKLQFLASLCYGGVNGRKVIQYDVFLEFWDEFGQGLCCPHLHEGQEKLKWNNLIQVQQV